jgi:outer membrane murein-binding lipoprotein Lpp
MSRFNRWLDEKFSGDDVTISNNVRINRVDGDVTTLNTLVGTLTNNVVADTTAITASVDLVDGAVTDLAAVVEALAQEVYPRSDVDTFLLNKADSSDVYSKTSSYSLNEIAKLHGLFRYPPVAPNNNTFETKIGTVLSSDNENRSTAYALFNQNNFSYWITLNGKYDLTTGVYQGDTRFIVEGGGYSAYGEWVQLSMENAFTLKTMSITTPRFNDGAGQAGLAKATARDFSLYGQTGTEPYQLIRRITDVEAVSNLFMEYTEPHVFDFDANTAKYQRYRLVIEKTNRASTVITGGSGFTSATIGEWCLYGHVTEFVLDHNHTGLVDNTDATYERII